MYKAIVYTCVWGEMVKHWGLVVAGIKSHPQYTDTGSY